MRDSAVTPKYKRILLKLSGEALMGDDAYGINRATIVRMVREVQEVTALGVEVAVVIGGGNIFRGVAGGSVGMDRATADYMGMLATVMNALALADVGGRPALLLGAFDELFYRPLMAEERTFDPSLNFLLLLGLLYFVATLRHHFTHRAALALAALDAAPAAGRYGAKNTGNWPVSDAAWPVASLKAGKYWAPVGRVDNVWGDRNLSCSCIPVSDYADD